MRRFVVCVLCLLLMMGAAVAEEGAEMEALVEAVVPEETEQPAAPWVAVTFSVEDQVTVVMTQVGACVAAPEAPVREGYAFTGWALLEETGEIAYDFTLPVLEALTLFAGFEPLMMAEEGEAMPQEVAQEAPQEAEAPVPLAATAEPLDVAADAPPEPEATLLIVADEIAEAQPEVARYVEIAVEAGENLLPGDLVTLRGTLHGYEGAAVALQWQYEDGDAWQDMPGATAQSLSFALDRQNAHHRWRLLVQEVGQE